MKNNSAYVALWRLHAKTAAFRKAVLLAESIVRRAAIKCPTLAVCWSGGKDSTAMAHLVRRIVPDAKLVVQFDDCDWPGKRPYIDEVCGRFHWTIHAVEPDFSVWEAMKQEGNIGNADFCSLRHWITREAFIQPLESAMHLVGARCVCIGLRDLESKTRKINSARRGTVYQLANGSWRCLPMAKWTARDVFAYLILNNIPINPYYLSDPMLHPEDVRLSWAIPVASGCDGGMEKFRRTYPERFRALRDLGLKS